MKGTLPAKQAQRATSDLPRRAGGVSTPQHRARPRHRRNTLLFPGAFVLATALLGSGTARAEDEDEAPTQALTTVFHTVDEARAVEPFTILEFSVGTYQGFDSSKIFRYGDEVKLIPTTSALFFIEYFFTPYWRASLVYNMPVGTEKREINGQIVERAVDSTVALGPVWAPFQFPIRNRTRIELQGLALAGFELGSETRFIPILMGRIHVSAYSDESTGVGVYLGTQYLFRIESAGVLYGVAYRF